MKEAQIRKIAEYGEDFFEKYLKRWDKDMIINDWYAGLKFFLHHSFYQGRRDSMSEKIESKVIELLDSIKLEKDDYYLIKKDNRNEIKNKLSDVIGKGKLGRDRDIKMVISILEFISRLQEKNIVKYSIAKIKDNKLKELFNEITEIFCFGPKITSFYLRNLVCLYMLESNINKNDLKYIQPIDTWIRKIVYKIGIIDDENTKDEIVRENIVQECEKLEISAMKFNQGAWFLGYNSFNILIEILDKI